MWERGDEVTIRIERMDVTGVDSTFYFGDENTDGSWRLIIVGNDLVIQKREAGTWTEKSAFTP